MRHLLVTLTALGVLALPTLSGEVTSSPTAESENEQQCLMCWLTPTPSTID